MTTIPLARTLLAKARRDFPHKGEIWRAVAVCSAMGEQGVAAKLFLRGIHVETNRDGEELFLMVTAIHLPGDQLLDEHRRKGDANIFRGHLERNGLANQNWRIDDVSASDLFWGQVNHKKLDVPEAQEQGRRMASQWKAAKLMRELGAAVNRTASKPRL